LIFIDNIYHIYLTINTMGQGLYCFENIWFTQCYECVGFSGALFCCSIWLCPNPQIAAFRNNDQGCCKVGCNQGLGSTLFCVGNYICIPDWLRDYSIWKFINGRTGQYLDLEVTRSNQLGYPQGAQPYVPGQQYQYR